MEITNDADMKKKKYDNALRKRKEDEKVSTCFFVKCGYNLEITNNNSSDIIL